MSNRTRQEIIYQYRTGHLTFQKALAALKSECGVSEEMALEWIYMTEHLKKEPSGEPSPPRCNCWLGKGATFRQTEMRCPVHGEPSPPDASASPVLAFQAWVAAYHRPLTLDEYFITQAAFFAAHPGKGPTSNTMQEPSGEPSPPTVAAKLNEAAEIVGRYPSELMSPPREEEPEVLDESEVAANPLAEVYADPEFQRDYRAALDGEYEAAIQSLQSLHDDMAMERDEAKAELQRERLTFSESCESAHRDRYAAEAKVEALTRELAAKQEELNVMTARREEDRQRRFTAEAAMRLSTARTDRLERELAEAQTRLEMVTRDRDWWKQDRDNLFAEARQAQSTPETAPLWEAINELERAAWSRAYKRVQAARAALEVVSGTKRPKPRVELESASQFRRVTAMEASPPTPGGADPERTEND